MLYAHGTDQDPRAWAGLSLHVAGGGWTEAFGCVVVEDQPSAAQAVAAYVDLNGVRAGLVKDPKEYQPPILQRGRADGGDVLLVCRFKATVRLTGNYRHLSSVRRL